jgi:hypothetical protein
MSFEPGKLLQNVELKLKGRTAVLGIGEGVMVVALWVVLKDYALHPLFSTVSSLSLLAGIVGFLALGLLGKTRPEEVPDKSFLHVDQMGIYVAQGIGSHKDLLHLMKQITGMKTLPPPSHLVRGSATNPADYVPLNSSQASEIVHQIESGVAKLLTDFVKQTTAEGGERQLPEGGQEKPSEPPPIKGKLFD